MGEQDEASVAAWFMADQALPLRRMATTQWTQPAGVRPRRRQSSMHAHKREGGREAGWAGFSRCREARCVAHQGALPFSLFLNLFSPFDIKHIYEQLKIIFKSCPKNKSWSK